MLYDANDALAWAVSEVGDSATISRYEKYDAYYRGIQDLSFAGPKFQQAFGGRFREFAYNRMSAVVDAHADRLFVEGFSAESDGIAEAAKGIWAANRMDRRQDEVHQEAFALGDGYALVWPDPETGQPNIWPQRAVNMRVLYSDEQPGLLELAAKVWTLRDKRLRLNVYHPDRIERYVTPVPRRGGSALKPEAFVPYEGDTAGPVIANPYEAVPVFAFANNARTGEYGVSELRDLIPLQDALNKALADMLVAQESAAFPQRVIIGINASSDPYANPAAASAGAVQEGLGRFALGMDRILALADPAAKIAEFSAAALDQFISVAEGWDTRISRQSRVPVHYLSMTGSFPSGRALRTAETPFVSKLEDRQMAFGNVWEDAMRFALRVAGVRYDGKLEVVWRSAAPLASEDIWDLIAQQVAAGVPLEIAVQNELGWDGQQIAALTEALQKQAEASALSLMVAAPPSDGPGAEGDVAQGA